MTTVTQHGYVLVYVGKDHHLADVRGYAYEHRVVAERLLGRKLRRGEEVHHRDHIKANNTQDNLKVHRSHHEHAAEHRSSKSELRRPGERNPTVHCACGCKRRFRRFDRQGRPRSYSQQCVAHEIRARRSRSVRAKIDVKQLVADVESGKSWRSIAEKFGVHRLTAQHAYASVRRAP